MGSLEEKTQKDQPAVEFKADWRLKSIFAVIGLLNFVVAIDATSVSVALPVCLPGLSSNLNPYAVTLMCPS